MRFEWLNEIINPEKLLKPNLKNLIIVREGNSRKGRWVIKNDNEHEHHKTNY